MVRNLKEERFTIDYESLPRQNLHQFYTIRKPCKLDGYSL